MNIDLKIALIIACIFFVLITIFLYLHNVSKISIMTNKKKTKKKKEIRFIEIDYLFIKNKINKKRLYNNKFAFLFALINSSIISTTFVVIELINLPFMFRILIGFVLLLGLIYGIYGILGNILEKRGYQNELQ